MRINKACALHPQLLGQGVHLGNERVDRRQFRGDVTGQERSQPSADVVCQRVRRDVVRSDKCRIEKIAQRDAVSRLKADVIFQDSDERRLRNCHCLIEIASFFFCPIEYNARGRNFCQAADLQLFSGLLLFQHVAGLCIDDNVRLSSGSRTEKSCADKKCEKDEEKSDWKVHRRIERQHLNRRILIGNTFT